MQKEKAPLTSKSGSVLWLKELTKTKLGKIFRRYLPFTMMKKQDIYQLKTSDELQRISDKIFQRSNSLNSLTKPIQTTMDLFLSKIFTRFSLVRFPTNDEPMMIKYCWDLLY